MSLKNSTLVRVVLILVAIWLFLNIVSDLLDLLANSFIAAVIVLVLILWYLDYI